MPHPGEHLLLDYLEPLGISQADFANHIGVTPQRINEIVKGKRGITIETAELFAQAFDTTPEFWMNLQMIYDFKKSKGMVRRVGRLKRMVAN